MENTCWFCGIKEADEELSYHVVLKNKNDRNDLKKVSINRCSNCQKRHKKNDRIIDAIYIVEVIAVAVAIFVFKVDFYIVGIAYFVLQYAMKDIVKFIRRKLSKPIFAVCDVYKNEKVMAVIDEGYDVKRRF